MPWFDGTQKVARAGQPCFLAPVRGRCFHRVPAPGVTARETKTGNKGREVLRCKVVFA